MNITLAKLASMFRPGLYDLGDVEWNLDRKSTLIELQFGENLEDISEHVLLSIESAGRCLNRYPDTLVKLINKVSESKNIPERAITVVNGTDEAFRLLAETFIEPGNQCLMFPPTYPSIKPSIRLMQGHLLKVGLTEEFMMPTVSMIAETITPRTKMIYLANPNVPTGNLIVDREQIIELLALPVIVVVDECYYELSEVSVSDLVFTHQNLIVLRSFSKTYGLAGLRMGYVIADENITFLLRHVETSIEPFPPVLSTYSY